MRYEFKNGEIKRFISHNYKNVALAAATHQQQWMCYHLANRRGQEGSNFLYADDEIGTGKKFIFVHTYKYHRKGNFGNVKIWRMKHINIFSRIKSGELVKPVHTSAPWLLLRYI